MHSTTDHVLGHDDRTGDGEDGTSMIVGAGIVSVLRGHLGRSGGMR